MSMNLHLAANLDAETKIGKKVITERFELHQTPTRITYEILECKNNDLIFQAYSGWILSIFDDHFENVHAEDDFFCEKEPIGKEVHNRGKDHLKELKEWLDDHKEWDIKWYAF